MSSLHEKKYGMSTMFQTLVGSISKMGIVPKHMELTDMKQIYTNKYKITAFYSSRKERILRKIIMK